MVMVPVFLHLVLVMIQVLVMAQLHRVWIMQLQRLEPIQLLSLLNLLLHSKKGKGEHV